jgi:hypothetical protein
MNNLCLLAEKGCYYQVLIFFLNELKYVNVTAKLTFTRRHFLVGPLSKLIEISLFCLKLQKNNCYNFCGSRSKLIDFQKGEVGF